MMIKVQYDAQTQTLRLVDQEFRTLLEGDAVYDLVIPLALEEEIEDFISAGNAFIAHA
jgi:hypothetical protein